MVGGRDAKIERGWGNSRQKADTGCTYSISTGGAKQFVGRVVETYGVGFMWSLSGLVVGNATLSGAGHFDHQISILSAPRSIPARMKNDV